MSPEAQRIAIAKACGWKDGGFGPIGTLHDPKGCTCFDGKGCWIPDYLNDLNAMASAELDCIFTKGRGMVYGRNLSKVCEKEGGFEHLNVHLDRWGFSAKADQRAEAFLKTLNLWVD